MERCTTAFAKEWEELKIHKEREIISGVKVILDKDGVHISVHLEGLDNVPVIFEYGTGKDKILLHAGSPKDYDCTEEDKARKIAETVADAEIVYEGIKGEQIIHLQKAIDEYNMIVERIYLLKSQMGKS